MRTGRDGSKHRHGALRISTPNISKDISFLHLKCWYVKELSTFEIGFLMLHHEKVGDESGYPLVNGKSTINTGWWFGTFFVVPLILGF